MDCPGCLCWPHPLARWKDDRRLGTERLTAVRFGSTRQARPTSFGRDDTRRTSTVRQSQPRRMRSRHQPGHTERSGAMCLKPGSADPRRFQFPITVARLDLRRSSWRVGFVELSVRAAWLLTGSASLCHPENAGAASDHSPSGQSSVHSLQADCRAASSTNSAVSISSQTRLALPPSAIILE